MVKTYRGARTCSSTQFSTISTIDTDWGEKLYVDTQDVWDLGDHVAITIPQENIRFQ